MKECENSRVGTGGGEDVDTVFKESDAGDQAVEVVDGGKGRGTNRARGLPIS